MKRMFVVLAALAITGSLFAQATAPKKAVAPVATPKKVAAPATPKVQKLVGTVVSVDAIANTITLKLKTGDETLAVDKAAKITADGKEIKLADIAKDKKVAVHYKVDADKKVAVSIHVFNKEAKKVVNAPPKTPAPEKKK
jgi:hypothetical protein